MQSQAFVASHANSCARFVAGDDSTLDGEPLATVGGASSVGAGNHHANNVAVNIAASSQALRLSVNMKALAAIVAKVYGNLTAEVDAEPVYLQAHDGGGLRIVHDLPEASAGYQPQDFNTDNGKVTLQVNSSDGSCYVELPDDELVDAVSAQFTTRAV